MFSRKSRTKQGCAYSGMTIFASITAMTAAGDGISPSMALSALLQRRLMVWSTWCMEMAQKRICIAHDKSKECVKKFTRVLCAWDSGSVTVLVTDLLTRGQAGTQCPGSMWKKYHPHRLKKAHSETFCKRVRVKVRRFIVNC